MNIQEIILKHVIDEYSEPIGTRINHDCWPLSGGICQMRRLINYLHIFVLLIMMNLC